MRIFRNVTVAVTFALGAVAVTAQEVPRRSEAVKIERGHYLGQWFEIQRLAPFALTQLPKEIRAELRRRQCLIPQSYTNDPEQNAIRGEFLTAGEKDWAVLCSVGGASSILIFPGAGQAPVEIGAEKDSDALVVIDDTTKKLLYSRELSVMQGLAVGNLHPEAGAFDHDGIADTRVGRDRHASHIWYLRDGQWQRLRGKE